VTVIEHPGTRHVPRRPAWVCVVCHQTWPCAPAKVDLCEEYGDQVTSLAIYLSVQMLDAIDDMSAERGPAPADLYDRFLGWGRRKPNRGSLG
jgi:hypothetical protein